MPTDMRGRLWSKVRHMNRAFCAMAIAAGLSLASGVFSASAQQQGGQNGGNSGGQTDAQDVQTGTIDSDNGNELDARFSREWEAVDCPDGSYSNDQGSACVSLFSGGLVCPDGQQLMNERCVRSAGCPDGQIQRNGRCEMVLSEDDARDPVTVWDCPPGSEPDGEVCRDIVTGDVRCPGTSILMADGTCADIFVIPRGVPDDEGEGADEPVAEVPRGPEPCLALDGCDGGEEPVADIPRGPEPCLALGGCDPAAPPVAADAEPAPNCPTGSAAVDGACVLQRCPLGLEPRDVLLASGGSAQACCSIGRALTVACPPGYDQRRRCCVL